MHNMNAGLRPSACSVIITSATHRRLVISVKHCIIRWMGVFSMERRKRKAVYRNFSTAVILYEIYEKS